MARTDESSAPGAWPAQDPDLDWIREVTGAGDVHLTRLLGGGSRKTLAVDLTLPTGREAHYVLQRDESSPFEGTPITNVAREASVLANLAGSGIPAAELIAVHPDGRALLTTRLPGTNDVASVSADQARRLGRDLVARMADLHRLPTQRWSLDDMRRPAGPNGCALARVDMWQHLLDRVTRPAPTARLAWHWLRTHPPEDPESVSLLWGDAGPGNFLFEGDVVTGLLDWEWVHLGDPAEDLAVLSLKSFAQRQGTVGTIPQLLSAYQEASGAPVRVDVVSYYLVMALSMAYTTALAQLDRTADNRVALPLYLHMQGRHEMTVGQALAREAGVVLDEPEPLESDAEAAEIEILQAIAEEARFDADQPGFPGGADLLSHLIALAPVRRSLDRAELDDLAEVLGYRPTTVAEGRRAIDDMIIAGSFDEAEVIRWSYRSSRRRSTLWPAWAERNRVPLPTVTLECPQG